MAGDLFRQIKNALLDLQQSDYQSYERPLQVLGRLLQNAELADVNDRLKALADADELIKASEATQGGMVGSAKLVRPDDPEADLGFVLKLIERFAADPDEASNFAHTFFYSKSVSGGIHNLTRQLLIPFARDYETYVLAQGDISARVIRPASNKVFIVHGHDDAALQGLARFIERLGLKAIILKEAPNQGRTIIEKFEDSAKDVGFAIVLFTPDDQATSGGVASVRARQNVVFELGYFAGALGRGRVCLLRKGDVEIPSDLFGVVYTDMDAAEGWKNSLVKELKAAKLDFDTNRMWD